MQHIHRDGITAQIFKQLVPDFDSIEKAYAAAKACTDKPTVIISHSTKGKGVSFMENNVAWHGAAPNAEQYEIAMKDLGAL